MALSPESNEAFFREVDEELRREQLADFGKRYGKLIGIAVVVVLIAVAGYMFWHHRQTVAAEQQGETLDKAVTALGNSDTKVAQQNFNALANSKVEGYRAMAMFGQVDVAVTNKDTKKAIDILSKIAGDASLAQPFRDLATVRMTALQYDSMKPEQIINRLRPLAMKDSPWFGSAGEMVAIAYLRAGRRDLAEKLFSQIAQAENVPDSIKQRAVQMAGVLSSDNAAPAAPAAANATDAAKETKAK